MSSEISAGSDHDALLVIDVQNDFCSGGRLPVPEGENVVPIINSVAQRFSNVILTQDWHPLGHRCFASSHRGRRPFDHVNLEYGPQILWPEHCIQGTSGAEIHNGLQIKHASLILRKGTDKDFDSYSAFFDGNAKPTGLRGFLKERLISRVFICGLALDFCVKHTAIDAMRSGFKVYVFDDACKGIDHDGSVEAARTVFIERDIITMNSGDLKST